jgi:hypothetical protein
MWQKGNPKARGPSGGFAPNQPDFGPNRSPSADPQRSTAHFRKPAPSASDANETRRSAYPKLIPKLDFLAPILPHVLGCLIAVLRGLSTCKRAKHPGNTSDASHMDMTAPSHGLITYLLTAPNTH